MAVTSNKLTPILALTVVAIVSAVFFTNRDKGQASAPMAAVPLPKTAGADEDTPSETLATVVAANKQLRADVQEVIQANKELTRRLGNAPGTAAATDVVSVSGVAGAPSPSSNGAGSPGANAPASAIDVIGGAFGTAAESLGSLGGQRHAAGAGGDGQEVLPSNAGAVGYKVLAPMGYVAETTMQQGKSTTRYVRSPAAGAPAVSTSAVQAAQAAQAAPAKPQDEPYFTIPENSTLAGVTAMTSLIGRVPVNGRVTDPMQFKAMVGRNNLAANGWELPNDLAGMVITGVAIGDMALSCIEGKVRSFTFVFNDGTVRTVSSRRPGQSQMAAGSGAAANDLGFISDLHGNPCIQGKFVTNAPAYLTDIIGAKGLGVAAEALAQAQTTTMAGTNGTSSSITGNAGSFALGRMGSGATEELVRWLTERLKSSFDAVVTPSGQQLVVHLDREIAIDKPANARKIVHRNQSSNVLSGARYGLE